MAIDGHVVGGLLVTSRRRRHFSEDDAQLLAFIANQTAAAFEKSRLFDVTRRQIDELTVLHAVSSACAEAADEDALIERVTGIVSDTLFPAHLGFMLLDPAVSLLRSHASYRGNTAYVTTLGRGITGHVALTGSSALVADVALDPRYVAVEPGIRSELCVPLAAGDEILGVINVESAHLAGFSAADERLLSTIGRQVATALAKLRLFERLFQAEQQRAAELEAVRQASLGLTASLDLPGVLKAILSSTLRMVPAAQEAFVFQYHALDGGRLTYGTSLARDGALRGDRLPRPNGLTHTVAHRGESILVPDVRTHALFNESRHDWGLAVAGLPLKIGSRVVGVMNVIYPEPRTFPESELRVLRLLGDQAAIAIENARLFEAERSAREQAEALREVAATLSANLDRQQLLQLILEQLGRVVQYDSASIMLFDGDNLAIVAIRGFHAAKQQSLVMSVEAMAHLAEVIESARPVIIPDTQLDPRWQPFADAEYIRCWLGVPLSTQGRTIGLLNLDKKQPDYYTSHDAELAAAFANQAAVAIENARLLEGERRQLSLAQTLQAVGALLTAQMTLQEVFEHIFDLLAQVVSYDSVSVQLLAPDGSMQLAAGRGFPDLEIARENVRYVAERRRPETWLKVRLIVVSDTAHDPRWVVTDGTEYIRSWIGAALMVKGQLVGVLTTESALPGAYDAAAGETVQAFANQAAVAIENARLFEESQRQTRALSGLYDTALATGSVLETEVLLARLHDQVRALLNPDTFVVVFYHTDSEELEVVLAIEDGRPAEEALPGGRLPVGQGLTGWVVRNRRSLLVGDLQEEMVPVPPRHGLHPARSWLGVPLIARDRIIGAVSVQSFEPNAFAGADARFLESVASQVAIAIENARLYAEVSARAAELSQLYAAAQDLGATLEPQAVLQQLARHLTEAVSATSGYVMEVDQAADSLKVLSEYWSPAASPEEKVVDRGRIYALSESPAVELAIAQLTVVERHADGPGLTADEREEMTSHGVKSLLIVPIVARGQVLGEAEVWETRRRRTYTLAERRLLQTLCQHAAGVIENARLFEETVRHATEVTSASEILHLLNAATNIVDSFPQISLVIKSITGCERVSIALLDENNVRVSMLVLDQQRRELPRGGQFSITATAAANDVLAGRVHQTPDLEAEIDFPAEQSLFRAGFRSRLNLPLRVGPQVIGSLNLVWREPAGYLGANLPLLSQLADAVALAMEKTRLFDEARRRDSILEALAYASGQLLMPGVADDAMPDLLATLGSATIVSRAYIFFNHSAPDGALLTSLRYEWTAPGIPSQQVQPDWQDLPYVTGGLGRWMEVLSAGRPLDGLVKELPPQERGRLERLGVLSLAVVPIFSGGDWWGWLGFDDCVTERAWSGAEIEALKSAASALGAYLTRQKAEAAEREQRALAEALRDTAAILNSTLDLDEVLDHILADVGHVVPHEAANIMLIDEGEAKVVRNRDVLRRFSGAYMLAVRYMVAEVPNLKYMLETGQPAIITDVQSFPGWFVRPETDWIRSTVGAPILIKGDVIGFITLDTSQRDFYTAAHAERLQAFAHQAGLAIENARLYASIRQHAEELEQRVGERTRELAAANRRLTELDRLKDQFVSNVSHELRTPLTNIKLHLSLLEKRGAEVLPRYLPTLQRETERLRRLIEDLLDLSRLQSQTGPAQRDQYALGELINEVLVVHSARAESKNISLVYEPPAEPLLVPVDRAQMIQVFTNLIGNAVSYTPPGGRAIVSAERDQLDDTPGVRIRFMNNGPLIPAEDVPHLFRRFYRGRTAHDSGEPGTGLGLAICREIIERHGGQIEVISNPEQGTIFSVWLPLN
jgi:GAF domain-containing protein